LRPRRQRKQEEQKEQLAEARAVAQDDLIALNRAVTDHGRDVSIASSPDAVAEQAAALEANERGTRALDAARWPAEMGAVSRSVAEGRYRPACAEAVAHGGPKPGRRPMCFFDPRHGMSVADVSWAPPDGGPSRDVAICVGCERVISRGDQPEMRTVQDRSGSSVAYVNSGSAPAYWGGFGYGGPALTGFLLGEALATPPVIINDYDYGGYPGGADLGTATSAAATSEAAASERHAPALRVPRCPATWRGSGSADLVPRAGAPAATSAMPPAGSIAAMGRAINTPAAVTAPPAPDPSAICP
jgi:hypothetical protein